MNERGDAFFSCVTQYPTFDHIKRISYELSYILTRPANNLHKRIGKQSHVISR